MTNIIVKIMGEILSTLALATKQVKQGRLSGSYFRCCGGLTQRSTEKFVKKVLGENEIETVLHRLDRLTLDEARETGVQTLKVVYGLVQHRRAVMDGEQTVSGEFLLVDEKFIPLDIDDKALADNVWEALGQNF